MDYAIENESNTTNSSVYDLTSARIRLTATNGIEILVAGLVLIIILCVKAYRSILQRFFMWFVLALLISSTCSVASVFYKFYHHGDTVVIHVLDDRAWISNDVELLVYIHNWYTVGSLYYASVLFMRLCNFCLQTHN